jgi:hypothetical protein
MVRVRSVGVISCAKVYGPLRPAIGGPNAGRRPPKSAHPAELKALNAILSAKD